MSDEEIKKALECCAKGVYAEVCDKCPFRDDGIIVNLNCLNLEKYALNLINRQQAEIEKLKWEKDHFEFKVDDLNGKLEKFKEYRDIKNGAYEREIERLQSLCTSKDVIIKEQQAEIERLVAECGNQSGIGGIESNRHKPYCPNCGADMRGEEK